MRQIVDEKLHATLEKRLTDSFGLVTEQLGNVQPGLGEMKDLASGVGDLKRVLTNIKSRGGYGEVQLEMLIDQMLSPEQYVKNARVGEAAQQTVEFAIKLPGQATGEPVLLPVDAKFPRQAWDRLDDAQDRDDQEAVKQAGEKFGGLMDREEENIGTVQNTLRDVGTRTRAISRTRRIKAVPRVRGARADMEITTLRQGDCPSENSLARQQLFDRTCDGFVLGGVQADERDFFQVPHKIRSLFRKLCPAAA